MSKFWLLETTGSVICVPESGPMDMTYNFFLARAAFTILILRHLVSIIANKIILNSRKKLKSVNFTNPAKTSVKFRALLRNNELVRIVRNIHKMHLTGH